MAHQLQLQLRNAKHIVLREEPDRAAVLDEEEILQGMVRTDVSVVAALQGHFVTSHNCSLLTVAALQGHFELLIVYFSGSLISALNICTL